jgi:hypothetical protein
MLYREIIAFSSEIRMQPANTLGGRSVVCLSPNRGGTYNNRWDLKV